MKNIDKRSKEQELIGKMNENISGKTEEKTTEEASDYASDAVFWEEGWNGNDSWKNDYFSGRTINGAQVSLSVRDYNGDIIDGLEYYDNDPEDNKESRAAVENTRLDIPFEAKVKFETERLKKRPAFVEAIKRILENKDTQPRPQLHSEEDAPYEEVNHPKHYNTYDVEVIDMMERVFGKEQTAIFCKLNAFKYRMRAGTKPGQSADKDLNKERWYIDRYNRLNGGIPVTGADGD